MVSLLALIALAIVLIIDIRRQGHVTKDASVAGRQPVRFSFTNGIAERYFHASHSWAWVHRPRLVSVGADDFAVRFLGTAESIEVGGAGTRVRQGEPLVTLRHDGRSLVLMAPLSGVLLDINSRLTSRPALLNESPYDDGWIARMSPDNLGAELPNLVTGPMARRWRQGAQEKLVLWFAPRLGTVLPDGGQLSDSLGDLLSNEEWEMLAKILFPALPSAESSTPKPVTE